MSNVEGWFRFDKKAHDRPFDKKAHDRPFDKKAHDRPFDKKAHDRQNTLLRHSKFFIRF